MVSVIAFSLAACNTDTKDVANDENKEAEVVELNMENAIATLNDSIKLGTTNEKGVGVDYALNLGKYQLQLQFALPNAESKEKNKYNITLKDGAKDLLSIKADKDRAFVVCDKSKYVFTDLGANAIANMGANVKNGSMSSAGLVAIMTSFFDKATYSNDVLSFTGDATGIKTIINMLLPSKDETVDSNKSEAVVEETTEDSGIKEIFNKIKKYLPALDDVSFALELNTKTLDSKLTATVNHFVTTEISISGKGVTVGQMPTIEVPASVEGYTVTKTLSFNINGELNFNDKANDNLNVAKYGYDLRCEVSAVELISNALKAIANGTIAPKQLLASSLFISDNSRVYLTIDLISGNKTFGYQRCFGFKPGNILTVIYDRVNGINDDINLVVDLSNLVPKAISGSLSGTIGAYENKFETFTIQKEVFKYLAQTETVPEGVVVKETKKQALNLMEIVTNIFNVGTVENSVRTLNFDSIAKIAKSLPISQEIMKMSPENIVKDFAGNGIIYYIEDENGAKIYSKGSAYDYNPKVHTNNEIRYRETTFEPEITLTCHVNYANSNLQNVDSAEKCKDIYLYDRTETNEKGEEIVVEKNIYNCSMINPEVTFETNKDGVIKLVGKAPKLDENGNQETFWGIPRWEDEISNSDEEGNTVSLNANDTYTILHYGSVNCTIKGVRVDGTEEETVEIELFVNKVIGVDYSLVGVEQTATLIISPTDAGVFPELVKFVRMGLPGNVIQVKITIAPDEVPAPSPAE